ncbi:MAG: bifunctional alpha,alpha-trehalose-phosphate synthase (UDP-forming)/trehalose-phosphatase [Polyangiaceae bacterium]|nr:bifunctional alpha,alpha-trehalose-phosphate synthase (UDP-forming)/trehalose-phosphatase [Polyangiaceae bacterium]
MQTPGLIVASARLPVSLTQRDAGWEAAPSLGGLVTALLWVARRRPFTWFGWPGTYVPDSDHAQLRAELDKHGSKPVFIRQTDIEGFHQSFSNQTLWPLFHGRIERTRFDAGGWHSYRAVNDAFAEAIAASAQPADVIWVHDFQLTLLPALLRQRGVTNPVGFFMHTPFPAPETYRALPQREPVLEGMLGADLVAFNAHEYAANFRSAAVRVLGAEFTHEGVRFGARQTRVAALPIGIDPEKIAEMGESREARQELASLQVTYAGLKIIVGVDRFDYTKGIVEKLRAFEQLLETYPRWRHRVVLIQVAAPSRMTVSDYQHLKREVDELVGRINGRYGTSSFMPVVYVNQSVSPARLTGLYRAADIALITPVRDGMNLVALEYVAARAERGGTLILSEFTGAAHCLPGARLVNPYNTDEVAAALAECLERPGTSPEQFRSMVRFVSENTATWWSGHFLGQLEQTAGESRHPTARLRLGTMPLAGMAHKARRPLLLLGDGLLHLPAPGSAEGRPDPRLVRLLTDLASFATTYVVSGHTGETLEEWFTDPRVGLVSEHNLATRPPGGTWQPHVLASSSSLKDLVDPLLREFVRLTPGSAVEYRAAGALWHFRSAEPDHAHLQARELLMLLEEQLKGQPYTVHRGKRTVEIRPEGLSKRHAVTRLLDQYADADWLLVVGDETTDEPMCEAVPASWRDRTVTCAMGAQTPLATTWVESLTELLDELEGLVQAWRRRS